MTPPRPLASLPIPTPDGCFTAHYSARGLAALDFPSAATDPDAKSAPLPAAIHTWHQLTIAAINAALAGQIPAGFPPLDLSAATPFQRAVWEALRRIPRGESPSYAEIARRVQKPRAARAVGAACGANPIPILIPCHRVRPASGALGGYRGGGAWKTRLLDREGVKRP